MKKDPVYPNPRLYVGTYRIDFTEESSAKMAVFMATFGHGHNVKFEIHPEHGNMTIDCELGPDNIVNRLAIVNLRDRNIKDPLTTLWAHAYETALRLSGGKIQ